MTCRTEPRTTTSTLTGVTVYGCGPDEAALLRALAPLLGVRPVVTGEPLSAATVDLARGHRSVSVGHRTPITHADLGRLAGAGVEYVSSRSIGLNHVDVDHAARLGITVEGVQYSPDSVADYTLMLILMALRHARSTLVRAAAHDYRLPAAPGRELRDLTVGVVGTGRIGAAVVERLRGFGGRVLAYDVDPGTDARYVPLDVLLDHSDVVTLHTPLTPATHHLLDRARIARLKPGAYVVNTGRGALLDTVALVAALERGALGGAALDVLEDEDGIFYADHRAAPPPHPLLARLQRLPHVLVSPHAAYFTDHALRDAVEHSLANCVAFARRARG